MNLLHYISTDIEIHYIKYIKYLAYTEDININKIYQLFGYLWTNSKDFKLVNRYNINIIYDLDGTLSDNDLKKIKNIKKLYSYSPYITDEDLKYFKGIKELSLFFNTNITDNGLKYLTNLKELYLNSSKF